MIAAVAARFDETPIQISVGKLQNATTQDDNTVAAVWQVLEMVTKKRAKTALGAVAHNRIANLAAGHQAKARWTIGAILAARCA